MRRVLEADMKRITAKILPWILVLVAYATLYISLVSGIEESPDRNFYFIKTASERYALVSTIIGFAVLLGVYGDEFKSMVMIGVIGRGISRDKFVFAKFLDIMLLEFIMIFLSAVYVFALKYYFNVTLNAPETKFLICMFVFDYIEELAYVTIAALFYFMSENAAIGMFAYLSFQIIIPVIIQILIFLSPFFAKYKIESYYIYGLTSSAYSDFILGDTLGAFMTLLPAIAIYIVAVLVLTMLVFRKKELEF